jgi:alpha-tubulin suppressor-like RCC1 family protein
VLVSENVGPVVRAIYADAGVVCSILNDDSVHCIPESQTQIEVVPILENAARFGTDKGNQSAPLVVMKDGTVRSPEEPKTYPYDYVEVDGYLDVISATAGSGFLCGVHSSGDVTCSGANSEGVLCDGTMERHTVPAPARGLTNVVKVVVGFSQGCALDRSGDLRCWGRAVNGELGDGTRPGRSKPYEVPSITNATGICVGGDSTCALNDAAELRCWGRNHSSGNPVSWLSDVVQCSGGGNFCSVMKDGTVKCWGNSPMGDGTATPRSIPTTVLGLSDATVVASGSEHSCALRRDGALVCWGKNNFGELGDGTTTDRLSPVTVVGLSNASSVAVGSDHSCALLRDGTVRCWGKNDSGQLGNGTVRQVDGVIAPLGLPRIRQLSMGASKSYAVSEGGEVFTWGGILSITYPTNENEPSVITYDHTPHQWSGPAGVAEVVKGTYVRLLNGQVMTNKDNGWVFARGFGETTALDYSGHVCSVLTNGKVRCMGDGTFGQLGDGYTTGRPWPEMIAAW